MPVGRATRLIDDLLPLHDATTGVDGAIRGSFGDGYLVAHNPVYARVRRKTLAAGFRFSDEPPYRYVTLPLFSLGKAIATKVLPYMENVELLREIARERPRTLTLEHLFDCGLQTNRTMHESAHALSASTIAALGGRARPLALKQTELLKLELAESFANAVECTACFHKRTRNDRAFWDTNVNFPQLEHDGMRALYELLGEREAFLFELFSSLASFMLVSDVTPKAMRAILDGYVRPLRGVDLALVHEAFRSRLRLSVKFRTTITGTYLNYLGYRGSVFALLDFDWRAAFTEDERWARLPFELADLALSDDVPVVGSATSTRSTRSRKSRR